MPSPMQYNCACSTAVHPHSRQGGRSGQLMLPWMTVRRGPRVGSGMTRGIYPRLRSAPGSCLAIRIVGWGSGLLVFEGGSTAGAGCVVRHLRSPSTWFYLQYSEAQHQSVDGRLGKQERGSTSSNSLVKRRTSSPWLGSAIDSPVEEAEAQTDQEVGGRPAGSTTTAAATSATVELGWLLSRPSMWWKFVELAWMVRHFLLSGRWFLLWGGWVLPRELARTSRCSSPAPQMLRVKVLLSQRKFLPPTLLVLNCHCLLLVLNYHCLLLQVIPPPLHQLSGEAPPHPKLQEHATRPNGLHCGKVSQKGSGGARWWKKNRRRTNTQRQRTLDLALIPPLRFSSCFFSNCLVRMSTRSGVEPFCVSVFFVRTIKSVRESEWGPAWEIVSTLVWVSVWESIGESVRETDSELVCPCVGESNPEFEACMATVLSTPHRTYR